MKLSSATSAATRSLVALRELCGRDPGAGEVVAAVERAALALRTAASHPRYDAATASQPIADELALCLASLAAIATARPDPELLRVYRDLVTPTEVAAKPGGGARGIERAGVFVCVQEAAAVGRRAYQKFDAAVEALESRGGGLDDDAETDLFCAVLSLERFGQLVSLDTGAFDFLPEHLARAITRDHHGNHSDPERPEANTTVRMVEEVEQVRASGLPVDRQILALQNQYAYCATDNLGDAIVPIVLARRLPQLVRDGGLHAAMKGGETLLLDFRDLCRLAHFEDFGFFGSTEIPEGRRRSRPGEILLRDIIHIVLANFDAFDDILDEHGVDVSDRFEDLPPQEQEALVAQATAAVEENLTDYDARKRRVGRFKRGVEHFKEQIRASHDEMRERLLGEGIESWEIELLDRHVYYYYVEHRERCFASWDAPPLVHDRTIQWEAIKFASRAGRPSRWGFILAVPYGREPDCLTTSLVDAFGSGFPTASRRGDTLLFIFDPSHGVGPPIEVAHVLAERLRAHARGAAEPTRPDETRHEPGEASNVFSHDPLLYQDGAYVWTPERLSSAQRRARRDFRLALESGDYDKAVLLVGIAASGKSTWIAEHRDPQTAYYDSTLTSKEARRPLVEIAREAGVPIEAVVLATPLATCLERNRRRAADRRVPEHVMRRHADRLSESPPTPEEGFARVVNVRGD